MASSQENRNKAEETYLEIQCAHCGRLMFIHLNYAMERMGTWDLEEIEDTIAGVAINDGKKVEVDDSTGMDIDDGMGMEVDGADKSRDTDGEGYTVTVSHESGDRPCGKETVLDNKQFHQVVLAARKANRV